MTGVLAPLGQLFAPRAVALVGTPGDLTRPGARPLHFLRRHGYRGRIYPVNPRHREIGGLPAYPSVAVLPEAVDVAWIGVPGAHAAEAVGECGRAGIRTAIVLGAGFAEAGASGEVEQRRLREAATTAGVRLVGPNTVGFVNAWDQVALTFSTVGEVERLIAGPLVILSQSGGLGGCLLNRALDRGVGVGLFVSTGNEADLTLADYLEWVIEDGRARAVACLVEQVRAPERVARAVAAALSRGIAVVALKLGGSPTGARAARSHTGALVGGREAWSAWARAAGILEAHELSELVDTAAYLARTPPLEGNRIAMVTSSGGIAVMLADVLEPRGFRFAPFTPETIERVGTQLPAYATVANPLDITAGLAEETFGDVLTAVVRDAALDLTVVPLTVATAGRGRVRAEQVVKAAGAADKPLAVCWPGGSLVDEGIRLLDRAGVPCFDSVAGCAAALGASLEFRERRDRPPAAERPGPWPPIPIPERPGTLSWEDAQALLAAVGIAVPGVIVRTEADARAIAGTLSFPAVVKLLGPLHKTDAGGVRLGLSDPEAVIAAVRDFLPRGEGCLIQPVIRGAEVLVGAVRDPALGPFVVIAPGGTRAELYGCRAMRPAPVTAQAAEAMLAEVPPLDAELRGFRRSPAGDRCTLADVVARASLLAAGLGPRLAELDLNPVVVGPEGGSVVVVDARIILEASGALPGLER